MEPAGEGRIINYSSCIVGDDNGAGFRIHCREREGVTTDEYRWRFHWGLGVGIHVLLVGSTTFKKKMIGLPGV